MGAQAVAGRADRGEERTGLKRVIGPGLLFFFILGDMIGGGIYALVGEVGAEVGGAIWSAFAVAFFLAVLTALSYAELATKYPYAAGAALYVHKAFKNQLVTFVVAFMVMASGIASASALAKAFSGDYFTTFVDLPVTGVAIGFFVIITVINLIGISESVKMNAAFTLIEIAGLAIIIVIGVMVLGSGDADVGRNFEFKDGSNPLALIIAGSTLAFYALLGFEDSANVTEEIKEPTHSYPRALITAMLAAGTLYLLVAFTASMVVETNQLADSDAPLLEVVKEGPLDISEDVFSLIALFALANGALINMIMASRLVYGMASQEVVPKFFSKVLPGRRTPWVAILFTSAIGVLLIASTGDLGILADTTVMLLLIVFAIVNICVLVLRKQEVEHDHFKTWTPLAIVGAAVSLALVIQTLLDEDNRPVYVRTGILILIGLVLWGINRLGGGPKDIEAEKL